MTFNEKEKCFYSRMPWKSSPSLLGNNTEVAIKSHQNLKRKAHKNELHPPMIKETFQSMLSNEFIIKTDLLPPEMVSTMDLRIIFKVIRTSTIRLTPLSTSHRAHQPKQELRGMVRERQLKIHLQ